MFRVAALVWVDENRNFPRKNPPQLLMSQQYFAGKTKMRLSESKSRSRLFRQQVMPTDDSFSTTVTHESVDTSPVIDPKSMAVRGT